MPFLILRAFPCIIAMFRTRICRQVVVENKEKIRNGVYEDEQEFLGNIAKALF